jgi:membrane protease YdiL (CAAX protease family)
LIEDAMTLTTISPAQLAFLLWTAVFFGAAISKAAEYRLGLPPEDSLAIAMIAPCVIEMSVVFLMPRLWHRAKEMLKQAVPRESYGELALIASVALLAQPARFGGFALFAGITNGDAGVIALGDRSTLAAPSPFGSPLIHLAITALLAPVVEELMYRGFLLPLWAERRSLVIAIIFTSLIFAAGHPNYIHAFMMGLLLGSLYARVGSLRAVIFVHFVANFTNFAPVLGQFAKPAENLGLASWSWHISALVMFTAITFVYLAFACRSPARWRHEALVTTPA